MTFKDWKKVGLKTHQGFHPKEFFFNLLKP
jgi:hypothetical protein